MIIDYNISDSNFFHFSDISRNSLIFFIFLNSSYFSDFSGNILILYSRQIKAVNSWFMFHINHLNLIDQSSLRTVLDWDIVITVDEILICWFYCLELFSEEGAAIVQLSLGLLFCCFGFEFLFTLRLLARRLTLVLGVLLGFYRFCTFRFSKGMSIGYCVLALVALNPGLPWVFFRREQFCRLGAFESLGLGGGFAGRDSVLFRNWIHFLSMRTNLN